MHGQPQLLLRAVLLACAAAATASLWPHDVAQAFDLFGPTTRVQTVNKSPTFAGSVRQFEEPFLEALQKIAARTSTSGADAPTRDQVRELLEEQEPYDVRGHLTTIDLLYRSGFSYELHNSTSADGYVTQLVRIVNPLAQRAYVKLTPVVLYAGQGASPAVFLMTAAAGGCRPLPWPRRDLWPADGLAGNRSLALTLANSGYDVWLVPARGVDAANRARVSPTPSHHQGLASQQTGFKQLLGGFLRGPLGGAKNASHGSHAHEQTRPAPATNQTDVDAAAAAAKKRLLFGSEKYWSFSDDEIVQFEFGRQLERVLELTAEERLSLVSYSNGGFITFAFMAQAPEFAHAHLDSVISLAPAVFVNKFNLLLGASGLFSRLTPPDKPFPSDLIDSVARNGLAHLCKPKSVRYSVCKLLLNSLYGHSDLFNTHLQLGLVDFIGRPLSARGLRQTLQVGRSGQLRRYDFGTLGNLLAYDQLKAPAYKLAAIKHERMFILSGGRDSIAGEKSVTKLISELECKPQQWINIPTYNHLDLLAAHDNAERVNLPVLHLLDERNLEANYYQGGDADYEDGEHEGGEHAGAEHEAVESTAPRARGDGATHNRDERQQQEPTVRSGARSANRMPSGLTNYRDGVHPAGRRASRYDDRAHVRVGRPTRSRALQHAHAAKSPVSS